jgi:uncharacterized membrane protein YsdA (DUF1294 family)
LVEPAYAAIALVAVNVIAFAMFGIDKAAARNGGWRIAEATLLQWAFLGGTVGAYAGRAAFRHKTRKQPFSNDLHTIAVLQALAVASWVGWTLGGAIGL